MCRSHGYVHPPSSKCPGCVDVSTARSAFHALAAFGVAVAWGEMACFVALDSYGGPPNPWPVTRDDWQSQWAVDILRSMVSR
jgi:hypothetical protein